MDEGTVQIVSNVFHARPLGVPIAVYFYMTGMSAGSFILSTLAYGFGIARFKPVGKIGVVMAILLLAMAPMNLIADLSQPLRFWHLFPYLQATSPITYGSFLLSLYPLNCVVYGFFMYTGRAKLTKIFGLVGIPLAISVHGYTGFILALGKGRALWNTALMPTYFLVSAMVSGIALMVLVVMVYSRFFAKEKQVNMSLVSDLSKMLAVTLLFDLFLVFSDVAVLLTADQEAREVAQLILTGKFAPYYVGLELALGSVFPVIILMLPSTARRVFPVALACFFAVIGVLAMRYVMVIGGQSVPLS